EQRQKQILVLNDDLVTFVVQFQEITGRQTEMPGDATMQEFNLSLSYMDDLVHQGFKQKK
ncbi:MAG: hypothetical protein ABR519_01695, partial [Bacteroidales bacterium]